MLNLGFGMDMDATGYDNIFIRGLILGMSKAELRKKADAIAEFSELGEFLDLPMRTYSSGMRARLAFAISTMSRRTFCSWNELSQPAMPVF